MTASGSVFYVENDSQLGFFLLLSAVEIISRKVLIKICCFSKAFFRVMTIMDHHRKNTNSIVALSVKNWSRNSHLNSLSWWDPKPARDHKLKYFSTGLACLQSKKSKKTCFYRWTSASANDTGAIPNKQNFSTDTRKTAQVYAHFKAVSYTHLTLPTSDLV